MRLIDADALSNAVAESKHNNPHSNGMVKVNHRDEHDHFLRMISDASTIDPESLRPTAEWVDIYGGKYANPRYACSACGERALYKVEIDMLDHEMIVQALSDSCPNCGAKMLKGADNNA